MGLLIVSIILNCVLAIGVYLLDLYTPFKKFTYIKKQIIIGVLFGGASAFASSFGVEWLGAVVNVRDAAPLSAGLIFGAPAGIIAGLIGGLYRWFSVYWGAGTYTRLACSIATILAGFMAAALRKWMFDNKKPNWAYGIFIAVACEVIHMILIFITNMDNSSYAFEFVKGATLPMILGNAFAVGFSIIVISFFSSEGFFRKKTAERIANTFQRWLLICIAVAFLATSVFTFVLQNGISKIETQEVFTTAMNDVEADIKGQSQEFIIEATKNRHVGSNGFVAVCDTNLNMVIDNEYNGLSISSIGINPPSEMLTRQTASKLYTADIVNAETGYKETYMYVFKFVDDYCIIAAMPEAEATFMRDASVYTSVFMQIIVFIALFVFIYVLIKRVIINNLRKVNDTLAQITGGDLNVTVDVRTNEEFASLSDDINSTVTTLKRYIAEAAARIDKELEYAKQIQLSALPTNFPTSEEYNVYAQMIAAKEVGGDFYDFYKLNADTVAFLVADVSGKGIPAAMFMMTAKTIIKDLAESGMAVNDIFTKANAKLCENNESGMFVTAWMGILDIPSGKLQFANAGHNPPLLKKANGNFEYLKTRAGFVLAGLDGVKYRAGEIMLSKGDRLFLYTDGVTEATDVENKLYGEDRLLEFMNKNLSLGATKLLPKLKKSIDKFVGEAPQFDDITMLIFDYKFKKGEQMESKIFPAKTDSLSDVLAFIEQKLETFNCSMKLQTAICVAIEEVFVNVAHYAYKDGDGIVEFNITFDEESRKVTFQMIDSGIPFDPLKKEDPDISLSAEERNIGGLGIFITKKTMDNLSYAYENGKNILTMTKNI
ncbi:MAG: SpoIIE family protein phosphatase [Clostridia bacterium]|nr:SpoIIE family protein phosphatase [Clostridia bacterium]